jgi:hypothetical protein
MKILVGVTGSVATIKLAQLLRKIHDAIPDAQVNPRANTGMMRGSRNGHSERDAFSRVARRNA